MTSPYLQHLVSDPTFGYLFPHRLAIAAFGVANEYQLRKHFPKLQDGQHFVKIRGNDNVERLFYSLDGLLAIADLIGNPQAQSCKADLIQHTQPGGVLVPTQMRSQPGGAISPAQVQLLSGNPTASLYVESPEPSFSAAQPVFNAQPVSDYALANLPANHPISMLTQALVPQLERAIERSVAARMPSPPLPHFQATQPQQTPQDTAAMIFEAQHLANSHTLEAQRLVANQRPNIYHVEETVIQMSPLRHVNTWLESHDTWALTLMSAGLFVIISFSAYALTSAVTSGQTTRYQPQMETYQ